MSQSIAHEELISHVLDALKTKVSEFNFNNWFQNSRWFVEGDDENLCIIVSVPNKFVRDWILDNYLELIKFEFFKISNKEYPIVFKVNYQTESTGTEVLVGDVKVAAEKAVETSQPIQAQKIQTAKDNASMPVGVNSRYCFDNFVVGNSNQFVHAACRAVASNPARNYNPLFIYGGVGLGKTHLLNSIALDVLKQEPQSKIVLVSGEQFTNEVINSIRYDKTYDLRKKYRSQCDVLLIDDVQFIAGKERTMEEFFHTFNALYEARKQIVLTSDTLPKDIPNLEERLRSRFSWGLLADIQAPDFETRCAILRKKAEDEDIPMTDEVCHYIASNISTNVRDLEGCLVRISAFASLASVPITLALAKEVLKNVSIDFSPQLTIENIQDTVAKYFNLRVSDLKSARRHKNLAVPRQIAMYLCKKHVKSSFPIIGQKFGGKDHTTVIHAVQKIRKIIPTDGSVRENVENLEKMILQ